MKKLLILPILFLLGACDVDVSYSRGAFDTKASWYGTESGRHTADGVRFNPYGMTVAHRTLPLGTKLRVTNTENGRSVVVTVTDRGPAAWTGRSIDVSEGVANALGFKSQGVAHLHIEIE